LESKIRNQTKKLSSLLESKIRDVLNPANHHVIQQTGNVHITPGKCVYTSFEMMNCEDVDEVIDSATATSNPNNIKENGKINIQNSTLQLTLRNQTTNLINMKVYEYICRRDVPDKMQEDPAAVAEVDGTTQNAITYGFNYQKGDQIKSDSLGGTLFQNPFFCTYYKITRVKNIQLGAGKVFNLNLSNLKARVINPLLYNNKDGDVLAGLTRGFVIQASGSLVGPSESVYGQPTTGVVNYDWFCSRKYAFNQPWMGMAVDTFASNVPQEIKNWEHINEYTGLPQVQQEA